MKGKKYKRSEAWMKKIFEKAFGLRQPYQLLVDGEFCRELLKCKIVGKEILPIVFGGQVKILASTCTLEELRVWDNAEKDQITGSAFIAKRFEQRTCRHSPCLSSVECIRELVGSDNPHHYAVAVQNYEARKAMREIPGVPLIFVNRGIVLMEDPSKKTRDLAHEKELAKLKPKEFELKQLGETSASVNPEAKDKKKKKKKGKKNPNPLSQKKSKSKNTASVAQKESKPKRKRKSKKNNI